MYENNPAYQEYPEVTPDTGTIEEPNDHKKAVATAVGGSVVLGAAAYGLSLLDDTDTNAPVADNASAEAAAAAADARARASAVPVVPVSMPADVDKLNWPLDRLDELTFDEAFAAARHQMGPAHHFNWHDGLYNTFLQQEEANLTAAERSAFIATLPGSTDSASTEEPANVPHNVHPSGGGHHHHVAPVASEPQLAELPDPAPVPVAAAVAPAITVVPLAAVADNEVTPLIDDHSSLIAGHSDNSMHHGSLTDGSIDSVDQHGHTDHDTHDEYDGMDHHHLGQ